MPTLLDRIGQAIGLKRGPVPEPSKGKASKTGKVLPDLSLWAQFQRVGGSLTPQQVSDIIRQADTGYMWRLMDLANEARQKDCHLQSVLETSEQSIAELEWKLLLPEDAKKKEIKAAEFVTECLLGHPQFPKLVAHHAGARFYSYAVTEQEFLKDGRYLVPGEFEFHPPRRFGYDQQSGTFIWRDWNQPNAGVDFIAEWPDRFIVSRPRINGDVPVREGLVRVLMWATLFRTWTISDWLKLGEIAWKPWRTGTYKKGAEDADIDELVAILEGLTSSGVAVYPETANVTLTWPGNSGSSKPTHAELFSTLGSEVSKVVLGQTETTESSKSSGYAQAKVHEGVEKKKRNGQAKWVGCDLDRDLVKKLYKLNFGSDVRPGVFQFITDEPEDLKSFSEGIKNLTGPDVRLRVPAKWVRLQAGIPEPEKDEELIGISGATDPLTGLPLPPEKEDPSTNPDGSPKPDGGDPNSPADTADETGDGSPNASNADDGGSEGSPGGDGAST